MDGPEGMQCPHMPAGEGLRQNPGTYSAPYELCETPQGLTLVVGSQELRCDFTRMLPRLRVGRLQHELLVRAAKVRGVESATVVDATAGLGEDSLLLAAAGFEVQLFERDATIAALLADGLRRAAEDSALADAVGRMRLCEGDSVDALRAMAAGGVSPHVVYLDPMFPAKRKSAAVKKKLQLMQVLERPCGNEGELFAAAREVEPRKLVVKRPAKGPHLAGVKPSYSLAGKAIRYDVYV